MPGNEFKDLRIAIDESNSYAARKEFCKLLQLRTEHQIARLFRSIRALCA